MGKLQRRARQEKATEIGRWKAFVASFLLGVSNLRRRRLRTALTCMTLIILTFTVMSFTSVKSIRHHTRLMYQPRAPYQGYFFKNFNWQDLPPEALDVIANHFEGKGTAAPRVWLEDQDQTRSPLIPLRFNDRLFEARGMIGLSADEPRVTGMDRILTGGRWIKPGERRVVMLAERIAEDLGLDPQRLDDVAVELWGMPFQVVGVFSGSRLMEATDLDGEPITPVTFPSEVTAEMTDEEMEAMESGEDVRSFQSRYQHTDGDLTVIVPYRLLLSNGGRLKSISVRPPEGQVERSQARHLVDRFGLMLFSGEPEGIFVYHASDTMSYSGVPNIVIPLVISIFIVLNTMIGSVVERKREIGIYTSVGLAPSHVSFLFIAESVAFAVLSVVLGYLLAQVTASQFAGTALWSGITVNYSSMAGVAAMVLVMLVVLVSAIYPSRVAAEIAIPDVNRAWKLPEAVDNRLEVTLPFLMNYREHLSVGGFLLEHFDSHKDISHGLFSAGDIDLSMSACKVPFQADANAEPRADGSDDGDVFLQMKTNIWLAPFDFGIMQKVDIAFCRSAEEPGALEIRVRLERLAGEANSWRRINKAFLHQLRKQLLVWRSLDADAKQQYEQMILDQGRARGIEGAMQHHLGEVLSNP
jgi:cell division protein FtsX